MLNAAGYLSPAQRVRLAGSVGAQLPLNVQSIDAHADDLLAHLLRKHMVADDATSFSHFAAGGFASIGPAIEASNAIADFVQPPLVSGIIDRLLTDARTAAIVAPSIVADLAAYVPDDDWPALAAVAAYARNRQVPLTPGNLYRIAATAPTASDLNVEGMLHLLATAFPPATAEEIVAVLARLGKPWSAAASASAEFEVPKTDDAETLLTALKDAGRCSFRKATGRTVYKVTVPASA